MYAHLSGILSTLAPDHAVIECHGVGYLALCSTRTLAALSGQPANPSGVQPVKLLTRLVVREDAQILYGFADATERDLFDKLTTVSGVGPRLALSLLSSFAPEELVGAVQHNQPATLARASGVGKKLAEKIIVELKDKLGTLPTLLSSGQPVPPSMMTAMLSDLTSALTNLGYAPKVAESAAAKALQETPGAPFALLFRAALAHAA